MDDPVSPKPASRVSFLTVRTTSGLRRQITDEDVATYHREGVVLLPGMFDDEWIDLLDDGLDTQLAAPTARVTTAVNLASRVFAAYFLIQIALAAMLARRQRNIAAVAGFVLIGLVMATILIFGLPL